MKRRSLLLSGTGLAGALVVGWGLLPARSRLGRPELLTVAAMAERGEGIALNGWLRITPEGRVQLACPKSEMGQGVHTALAMLVAEELDVALSKVRVVDAGHDAIYGNVAMIVGGLPLQPEDSEPGRETAHTRVGRWMFGKLGRELNINATGGSSSIADLWDPLRQAAATARGQLLGAASLQWKLPLADLLVTDGVVSHPSGPRAHYGELAKQAAHTPPGEAQPKPRAQWKLIGSAAPRTDIASKSNGSARFGIDVRLPGLVYAAVRHAPALGGSPGAFDATQALALAGVERVLRLPSYAGSTPALAVIGRTSWHAQRGADALEVDWRARPAGALDSRAILAALETTARDETAGFVFHARGADARDKVAASPRKLEAVYRAPYLAHATMEPINCTARVAGGKVEVWAPTQVPGMARALAAQVAGVDLEAVTVHVTYLGGGFGRRLEIDVVGQAVRVAMETGGRPVQLLWSRAEDLMHDFYRPAGVAVMRAALDSDGLVTALAVQSAGDAPTPRWMERALAPQSPAVAAALVANGDLRVPASLQGALRLAAGPLMTPDKTASEGLFDLPYDIPSQRIAHVATKSGVPVGFWRAVGHSHNAFFAESFIDELAHESQYDPVAYRLAMLKDMPRHAAVLTLAAEKAGWGSVLPAGRARGVALHESFDSIVAEVVEVSLNGNGKTARVHRVVCAVDCGTVVNPGIVAQQMESGIVFALSAALYGRIDIDAGVVEQRNFPDYPLLALKDTPVIETHIVPSQRHPGGVGEVSVPPLAPALGNALFALTGRRLRELPLTP
jgi:isoquinoline 1-oxidoreductase subunit beta